MEYYYGERLAEYAEKGDLESIGKLLHEHPEFNKGKIREAMVNITFLNYSASFLPN